MTTNLYDFHKDELIYLISTIEQQTLKTIEHTTVDLTPLIKTKSGYINDGIDFLRLLANNPEYLISLVKGIEYFQSHHEIRTCDTCLNTGGCDDCYSGDTEYEHETVVTNAMRQIINELLPHDKHFHSLDSENEEADNE